MNWSRMFGALWPLLTLVVMVSVFLWYAFSKERK